MNEDLVLLKSASVQVAEQKVKIAEKIRTAVNSALGTNAVNYVSVEVSKEKIVFQLMGKL